MQVRHTLRVIGCLLIVNVPALAPSHATCHSQEAHWLIHRINTISAQVEEGPGAQADPNQWEAWYPVRYTLQKQRISLIELLEQEILPTDLRRQYVQLKYEDIRHCMLQASDRGDLRTFRDKLHRPKDGGDALNRELAEESFWWQNIYYIHTHGMSLSERDLRKIAKFEAVRRTSPAAGRLLYYGLTVGRVDEETRQTWEQWIVDLLPQACEGHRRVKSGQEGQGCEHPCATLIASEPRSPTPSSE